MCDEKQFETVKTESKASIYLPPKRMNPADTIFNLIKTTKETILGLGVGAISMIRHSPKSALIFIGIYLLLLLVWSFFGWLRHTYRVEDGELRIEKGVFIRKRSYISINRIHTIDLTANVLHRMLRLVRVIVNTADGENETVLSALTRQDAEKVRRALQKENDTVLNNVDPALTEKGEQNPRKQITWGPLFLAGMTSGGAGVLLLGGFALIGQVEDLIPDDLFQQTYQFLHQFGIVLLIILLVLLLFGLWLIATLGTVIKFGHFKIEKREKELVIKRGLLETKEITIPYDRIQAIEVEQSILRKPLKFSRVIAVTAGNGSEFEELNPIIFPLLKDAEVEAFLQSFVPDYARIDPEHSQLTTPGKKGLKYYLFRHAYLFVVALSGIAYAYPRYSWIPGLLLVASLGLGWLKFAEAGYRIDGKRIIVRNWHMFTRSQMVFYQRRMQAMAKHQQKLQQMDGLATIDFSLISLGAQAKIRHLIDEDANRIGDWGSHRPNH